MSDQNNREEIYSRPVRAGKRTYFFDVKATRGQDLYMTITESKRRFDDDGNVHYQKHKIFLYREDFENFEEGFVDAVQKIDELMATGNYRDPIAERKAKAEKDKEVSCYYCGKKGHRKSDLESMHLRPARGPAR